MQEHGRGLDPFPNVVLDTCTDFEFQALAHRPGDVAQCGHIFRKTGDAASFDRISLFTFQLCISAADSLAHASGWSCFVSGDGSVSAIPSTSMRR